MRYDELLDLISKTEPDEWVQLSGEPSIESIQVHGDGADVEIVRHHSVAYLRSDLDVSLRWGAPQNGGEAWSSAWVEFAKMLPDSTVYGIYADLCWRGQSVERTLLTAVDGHRAYLPAANADYGGPPPESV